MLGLVARTGWRGTRGVLRKLSHRNVWDPSTSGNAIFSDVGAVAPVFYSVRLSTTAAVKHLDKLIIEDHDDALEIATRLTAAEQAMLLKALEQLSVDNNNEQMDISRQELRMLFIFHALPFVGFGFLDNMIMLVAGEYIDQQLGVLLCLSTMAAAGFGNLISDVAGIGLAHYVEIGIHHIGIRHPVLTPGQIESSKARYTTNLARAIGLAIGCVIGMFPLLFFDKKRKRETTTEASA